VPATPHGSDSLARRFLHRNKKGVEVSVLEASYK
jgi:hypothetical protein